MFRPLNYLQAYFNAPKHASVSLLFKKMIAEEETLNRFFLSQKELVRWIRFLERYRQTYKNPAKKLFAYHPKDYQKERFYNSKSEVIAWCEKMKLENYHVREDLIVDVTEDVDLSLRELHCFPVRFGVITGNFNCSKNKLVTLKGAPEKVYGCFDCSMNYLVSLKYGPTYAADYFCQSNYLVDLTGAPKKAHLFDCSFNQLISLKGAPLDLTSNFNCSYNHLVSLEYAPQIIQGSIHLQYNQLQSLSGFPIKVKNDILLSYNPLTNLQGLPRVINGSLYCNSCSLTSLAGAPVMIHGTFDCSMNKLESLLFGPIKVDGHYYCSYNRLMSLQYCAQAVGQMFDCSHNLLKNLDFSPHLIGERFLVSHIDLSALRHVPASFQGTFEHLITTMEHAIPAYSMLYVPATLSQRNKHLFFLLLHADEIPKIELNQMLHNVLTKKSCVKQVKKI